MSKSRNKKSKRSSKSPRTTQPPASSNGRRQAKTFPYRALGPGVLKPLITLRLTGPSGPPAIPVYGLVDSGADCSTFPLPMAKPLGIDLGRCQEVPGNTAGGVVTQYRWPDGIEASVAGKSIRLSALFNPRLQAVLLGREDFFAAFRVEFDQRSKTFRLESYI